MIFLNTRGLAKRWQCSIRKVEQQRQSGGGPTYVKIGNQVLYSEDAVHQFEAANTFGSTSEADENTSEAAGRRGPGPGGPTNHRDSYLSDELPGGNRPTGRTTLRDPVVRAFEPMAPKPRNAMTNMSNRKGTR
jgi:hypothetical protein